MRLNLTTGTTTVENAWGLVGGVGWSGDKRRAARTLTFELATSQADANLPAVPCTEGTVASLWDDEGRGIFQGVVTNTALRDSSPVVSVTCHDGGMYLANNDGTLKVREETPEDAVARLCQEYGISVGELAATGVRVSRKFASVSLWGIVTTLYTLAAQQTGKRYQARFEWDKLTVRERTEGQSSLVIRPYSNLLTSSTSRSIESMRNSVGIYDKDGRRLDTIRDEAAVALYGLMERHMVQRDGEDARPEAQRVLQDNGLAQSITVTCLGDTRLTTGQTVVARNLVAGLSGILWIDSDKHSWTDGIHTATLTLNLRNVMYEGSQGGELT